MKKDVPITNGLVAVGARHSDIEISISDLVRGSHDERIRGASKPGANENGGDVDTIDDRFGGLGVTIKVVKGPVLQQGSAGCSEDTIAYGGGLRRL